MTPQVNKLELEKMVKAETDFLIDQVNGLEGLLNQIIEEFNKDPFGNSQIRNLLHSARAASGIKEISLFIQYQMAREKIWSQKFSNGQSLGHAVIAILQKIEERVKAHYGHVDEETRHELLIRLVERFFLYWAWKYKYLRSQDNQDNGQKTKPQSSQHRQMSRR